ncbi:MAG: Uncharacterised protein [Cyanobium sp. ARS6]|nr:MAG: Uncharacterised protein [Cyanobium sp. ARS6]
MQKAFQASSTNQRKGPSRSSFTIEGHRSDVSRVKTVVSEIEERNSKLMADRVGLAEADTVQNGSGIEHAAE